MKLSDIEYGIGTVKNTDDEKHLGRVKAHVPGMVEYNEENDLYNVWMYPRTQQTAGCFRKPKEGDKIHVYHNTQNAGEYFYEPFPQLNAQEREILTDYENTDILLSKTVNGQNTTVYASEGDGFVTRCNGATEQMNENGEIILKSAKERGLVTEGGTVTLGTLDEPTHPAINGDTFLQFLDTIKTNLNAICGVCNATPQLQGLVVPVRNIIDTIDLYKEKLPTKTVKIN